MASTSSDRTHFNEAGSAGPESKDYDHVEEDKHCIQKRNCVCEMILLAVTIGVVWSLMLLPIIFWHLPINVQTVSSYFMNIELVLVLVHTFESILSNLIS